MAIKDGKKKKKYIQTTVEGKITEILPKWVGIRVVSGEDRAIVCFKTPTENLTETDLSEMYNKLEVGDFIKVEAMCMEGANTHHTEKLIKHKKGERIPVDTSKENGAEKASEGATEPKEVEAEIVTPIKNQLAPVQRIEDIEPFVYPIVEVEKVVNAFAKFKEIKTKVLQPEDFCFIDKAGKWSKEKPKGEASEYIEKTGWQKIALAFSLDIELISKEKSFGTDNEGKYYVWSYTYRISHPSGKFVITEGSCSSRDPFFSKSHGRDVIPNESDIKHTAQTVCINRGVSIMVGGGVTADEIRRGRDELGN
jgi:hypothetical protein